MLGDHRCGAVVDKQTGIQRLGGEHCLFAGGGLGHGCAAARAGHSMEVDRVRHRAIGQVAQVNFDGVADAHAVERSGYFSVERPVLVGCSIGQLPLDLDSFQINADCLRFAQARLSLGRDFGRIAYDIRACGGIVGHDNGSGDHGCAAYGCGGRGCVAGCLAGYFELPDHAGFLMTCQRAIVGE